MLVRLTFFCAIVCFGCFREVRKDREDGCDA